VDGRLLKYIELDYTISDFEAIMPVDVSERKIGDQRTWRRRRATLANQARDIKVYRTTPSRTRVVIEDAVRCTENTGEGGLYRKARHLMNQKDNSRARRRVVRRGKSVI
jgi:hypothetical protein